MCKLKILLVISKTFHSTQQPNRPLSISKRLVQRPTPSAQTDMFHVKIAVVGPATSGKTYISNFLADQTEIGSESYRPTRGCRILEYEEKQISVKGRSLTADVELWDCAGDKKYDGCWPALAKDAVGEFINMQS